MKQLSCFFFDVVHDADKGKELWTLCLPLATADISHTMTAYAWAASRKVRLGCCSEIESQDVSVQNETDTDALTAEDRLAIGMLTRDQENRNGELPRVPQCTNPSIKAQRDHGKTNLSHDFHQTVSL
jgi:hypothetical protein